MNWILYFISSNWLKCVMTSVLPGAGLCQGFSLNHVPLSPGRLVSAQVSGLHPQRSSFSGWGGGLRHDSDVTSLWTTLWVTLWYVITNF
jgi:hypothetical protein